MLSPPIWCAHVYYTCLIRARFLVRTSRERAGEADDPGTPMMDSRKCLRPKVLVEDRMYIRQDGFNSVRNDMPVLSGSSKCSRVVRDFCAG